MDGTPFGRYRLVELLGRGGMGEVWRAYDTVTDRVVAIKVLPANFVDDQVFQERFRREARSAAGLDEPHVRTECRLEIDLEFSRSVHHGRGFSRSRRLRSSSQKYLRSRDMAPSRE